MWRVPRPSCSAQTAYETCTRGMRNREARERFSLAAVGVERADKDFRKAGESGAFRELDQADFHLPEVSAPEMRWLYDHRLVAKASPGRVIYEQIRMSSPGGRCPLCGHREVMTVDHYLPKASYPALAVNPANLIPACSDCNKTKSSKVIDIVHPYFDDVENDQWLRAAVIQGVTPVVRYRVSAPAYWPGRLAERVVHHFELFGLGPLYSAQAAREMSGHQRQFTQLLTVVGPGGLREHLTQTAQSWRDLGLNSWQGALYESLAASSWYYSGGFQF